MKYLHLEFDTPQDTAYLFNTREPDWDRTLLLIRRELMRQFVLEGEDLDLGIRVRFLKDSLSRFVRDDQLIGVMSNGE